MTCVYTVRAKNGAKIASFFTKQQAVSMKKALVRTDKQTRARAKKLRRPDIARDFAAGPFRVTSDCGGLGGRKRRR